MLPQLLSKTGGAPGSILASRRLPDFRVLLVTCLLLAYGLIVVYSASLSIADASLSRQVAGVILGLLAGTAMALYDFRNLKTYVVVLLVIDCALMLLPFVPGLSYSAKGMVGWISIPGVGVTFQPSELCKPITIVMVAAYCSRFGGRMERLGDYLRSCGLLAIPFLFLMATQRDLGTGAVIFISGVVIILMAGPRRRWVLATLALLVGAVALILATDGVIDQTLGDSRSIISQYQMNRLLVFLDNSLDSQGSGYNLQQAMIAVGSGGLTGKGIGNATQSTSGFLPEAHTDFVFALLSEEFGLVGVVILLALYAALIWATVHLAGETDDLMGKLILMGIAGMWLFQVYENIGMCLSLMPITGIPLPFISCGGSSMIVQLITVGLVQSVARHR